MRDKIKFGFGNSFGPGGMLGGRGAAPWYRIPGLPTPIAVYQPIGALSYAASKVNLISPGTYDLIEQGGAVGWNKTDGWIGDGVRYFKTGIIANQATHSMFARFSNASGASLNHAGGWNNTLGQRFGLGVNPASNVIVYRYGNFDGGVAPVLTSGTIGLASQHGWRNGVSDTVLATTTSFQAEICIMSMSGLNPWLGNEQAFIVYDVGLTPAQILTLHDRMMGLTADTNPT